MKDVPKGKHKDIEILRIANRAASVGRLMLGETRSWEEFLKADTEDLESIPRRILRSGVHDVKKNVLKQIKRFCSKNFEGLSEQKLNLLYEEIKAKRGLEIPLNDFEVKYRQAIKFDKQAPFRNLSKAWSSVPGFHISRV